MIHVLDSSGGDYSETTFVGADAEPASSPWTFLTNHMHVLICLTADPTLRIRDLADRIGITERAVHRILSDLADAGYLTRERRGRRNRYSLNLDLPMRHALENSSSVRHVIEAIAETGSR